MTGPPPLLLLAGLLLPLLLLYVLVLPLHRAACRKRLQVAPGALTVAFFHPYWYVSTHGTYSYTLPPHPHPPTHPQTTHHSNAGGGGERVLWLAIHALVSLQTKKKKKTKQKQQRPLHVLIYTGDVEVPDAAILQRAEAHFGVHLTNLPLPLSFVKVPGRQWLEAARYPVLTMLGQSAGSMLLALVCLLYFLPDVWVDTTGCAFTYPVAALIGRCRIAAYVHYPTISTDMLSMVREQRPSYNNDRAVAGSPWKSRLKLVYYHGFAVLYGLCGWFVSLVMVNSSWTAAHIRALWPRKEVWTVFPPCDIAGLQDLPLAPREPVILSVGQFRPEKDHPLQIRAFARFVHGSALAKKYKAKLVLLGSCRGAEDKARVAALQALASELGVAKEVEFVVGAPFSDLKTWLGRASVGVHTMWNEHFGICVVEYMVSKGVEGVGR